MASQNTSVETSGALIPIWFEQNVKRPSFPNLTHDVETDVIVIGGGISGLTAAYLLATEGKKVVLLEDGELGSGETGRTTAHLTNAYDDRFVNITKDFGNDVSRLVGESHGKAIDTIEQIAGKEQIECEFERMDGFLWRHPDSDKDYLEKEHKAANDAGFSTELVKTPAELNLDGDTMLRFPRQAGFSPLKYIYGVAVACQRLKVNIYTHTHAAEFKEEENFVEVTTSDQKKVKGQYLVVASNSPVDGHSLFMKMVAYRTYAIGAKIPKGSVPKGLYWDTCDSYHYSRIISGKEPGQEVLLVGGEDHPVGQDSDISGKFKKLTDWMMEKFPMAQEVVTRWSGEVLEPIDHLGFLGKAPGKENVFLITGDSGNGLTNGTVGALLVTDLIMKRENPWEKIYSPSRNMTAEKTEFVTANATAVAQYRDWVTGGDITDIESLVPGSGAIVRNGLKKEAVYKDEQGKVFKCSAVCPHKQGLVRWNSEEKSWDCPCHGSRFDAYGKVVFGPANTDLPPLESQ